MQSLFIWLDWLVSGSDLGFSVTILKVLGTKSDRVLIPYGVIYIPQKVATNGINRLIRVTNDYNPYFCL